MGWDDIDFEPLVTGCITSAYSETSARLSLNDVLNLFVDAFNEKDYAVGGGVPLIEYEFGGGSVLNNDDFILNFNNLLESYWQLWLKGWYSVSAITDVVNYGDYLLTNTDLIAATSQEFYDIISDLEASTHIERWSEVVFQNLKPMYQFMQYTRFDNEPASEVATSSGFITVSSELDGVVGDFRYTPGALLGQAECTAKNNPALGVYSIDTNQQIGHDGILNNISPSRNAYAGPRSFWSSEFKMRDFNNSRSTSTLFPFYRDKNVVFIVMKKLSTNELLTDIDAGYQGTVVLNKLLVLERVAQVDGGASTITEFIFDNIYPGVGQVFDAKATLLDGHIDSALYGYGMQLSYENGAPPNYGFTKNPPTEVCQNTAGKLQAYSEGHDFQLDLARFCIIDSNNAALDFFIAPTT